MSTEVLGARQIEILRGPATLLYGSGAIGGLVNVVTDRIPQAHSDGTRLLADVRGLDRRAHAVTSTPVTHQRWPDGVYRRVL